MATLRANKSEYLRVLCVLGTEITIATSTNRTL
nr:MAG TPA: Protein-arginine deiminase (PAD) N-terminal domain [Caudoviricetes sp.]